MPPRQLSRSHLATRLPDVLLSFQPSPASPGCRESSVWVRRGTCWCCTMAVGRLIRAPSGRACFGMRGPCLLGRMAGLLCILFRAQMPGAHGLRAAPHDAHAHIPSSTVLNLRMWCFMCGCCGSGLGPRCRGGALQFDRDNSATAANFSRFSALMTCALSVTGERPARRTPHLGRQIHVEGEENKRHA